MWIYANPNPYEADEPDCVVRAIAIATGRKWSEVHGELCAISGLLGTMPSVNRLWDLYLKRKGFVRFEMPEECPECVTIKTFCRMYPKGTYILGTGSHAVAVIDGNYYDTYPESGDMRPMYFYRKVRT